MSVAIPLRIGVWIAKTKIGAEVDNFQVLGQITNDFLTRFMRQCTEAQINLVKIDLIKAHELRQIQMAQMWKHLSQTLTRF